jgi:hypothetical protein
VASLRFSPTLCTPAYGAHHETFKGIPVIPFTEQVEEIHSRSLTESISYARPRHFFVGFLSQGIRVGEGRGRAVAWQHSLTREESEVTKSLTPPGSEAVQPGLTGQPTLHRLRHGAPSSALCRQGSGQLFRDCGRAHRGLAAAQPLIQCLPRDAQESRSDALVAVGAAPR